MGAGPYLISMKRQNILITACCLASVSISGNVWLLMHRSENPAPTAPPQSKTEPKLPSVDIDFSGTGLSDDSWKLTDEKKPAVRLDEPIDLSDLKSGIAPAERDSAPNNVHDKAPLTTPDK